MPSPTSTSLSEFLSLRRLTQFSAMHIALFLQHQLRQSSLARGLGFWSEQPTSRVMRNSCSCGAAATKSIFFTRSTYRSCSTAQSCITPGTFRLYPHHTYRKLRKVADCWFFIWACYLRVIRFRFANKLLNQYRSFIWKIACSLKLYSWVFKVSYANLLQIFP